MMCDILIYSCIFFIVKYCAADTWTCTAFHLFWTVFWFFCTLNWSHIYSYLYSFVIIHLLPDCIFVHTHTYMYTYIYIHYQQAGHNVIHFHNHCKHLGPGLSLVHPYCCSVYSILIYFIRISLCDLYLSCVFHSYCCCCYNTWISLRWLKKVYLIVFQARGNEERSTSQSWGRCTVQIWPSRNGTCSWP